MKRVSVLFLTGVIILAFSGISFGAEYIYTINNPQIHYDFRAYSWKINLGTEFQNDEGTLSSVKLEFDNIREYTDNDILHISVLGSDAQSYNLVSYYDNTNQSDYFTSSWYTGEAVSLFSVKNVNRNENDISVTYNNDGLVEYKINETTYETDADAQGAPFPLTTTSNSVIAQLTNYSLDNVLTLGIDPDCYYDLSAGKIRLILTTSDSTTPPGDPSQVPEPETLVLFGLGLLGVSAFGRKRFSSMG